MWWMARPDPNWFDALPTDRLMAEFSLWSADLVRLADDLARIEPFADLLHIDVADGHFAPALLFFPDLVARLRDLTAVPIHVHLMVADAVLLSQIDQFAEAGADLISVHVENDSVAMAALDRLARHKIRTGMVLRVETPVERVRPFVGQLDFLTLLGTAIGVKGQGLDPAAPARLRAAGSLIASARRRVVLAADGGIREATVPVLRAAGAETVVMGSLAFGARDLGARIAWARALSRTDQSR
jgi:ribulose-phosphate 3-epimerase